MRPEVHRTNDLVPREGPLGIMVTALPRGISGEALHWCYLVPAYSLAHDQPLRSRALNFLPCLLMPPMLPFIFARCFSTSSNAASKSFVRS